MITLRIYPDGAVFDHGGVGIGQLAHLPTGRASWLRDLALGSKMVVRSALLPRIFADKLDPSGQICGKTRKARVEVGLGQGFASQDRIAVAR